MKTIVVATDFSASAENAMLYAGKLATNIQCSILLLHVFQIPVGMNDIPVLMVSADELKNNADTGLSRAKDLLLTNFSGLEIQTESRLGDVIEELRDVCKKVNPLLIVVGKQGASGIGEILFGSTSFSIIRRLTYPVMVVPDRFRHYQLGNAALAVDADVENVCIQKINRVRTELKFFLHIIHVNQEKGASLEATKLVSELNSNYSTIFDHEFSHGIETYIANNNIDLLIILPRKHNLVERLLFKTHTKELLKKISIPIMCLCEN
jgi:nucleotide-binding universal stress UspA family protein